MDVRTNNVMAGLLTGVDLNGRMVAESEWPADVREIVRAGWERRPSGALVLAGIARGFNHEETDYHDLTGYEASVNQLYVPDDGIDLAADDALVVLAARGRRLARDLLARVDVDVAPTVLIAYVNVGVWFEGRPGGNLHIHEVHHGEPTWAEIDDLDGYQSEGVMAIIAGDRWPVPDLPTE